MDWSPEKKELFKFEDNYCVKAGAGSGKTAALVNLNSCFIDGTSSLGSVGIDEILAITFTELAAGEMRERLCRIIDEHIKNTSSEDLDEYWKWQTTRRMFAGAHISTFNSFCLRVLKENPLEAGLDVNFETVDEIGASELLEKSCDSVILSLANEPEFEQVLFNLPHDKLKGHIFGRFEEIENTSGISSLRDKLKNAYNLASTDFIRYVNILVGSLSFIDSFCSNASTKSKSKYLDTWRFFKEKIRKFIYDATDSKFENIFDLEDKENATRYIKEFRRLLLPIEDFRREFKNSARDEDLKEEVNNMRQSLEAVVSVFEFLNSYELTDKLITIFEIIKKDYTERKKSLNCVDFQDQMTLVRDLLQKNPRIRKRYIDKFKAVVVDEFQDVNKLQKDIVYLLCSDESKNTQEKVDLDKIKLQNKKLFVVGDLKQSIYGFRGANVAVFSDLIDEMETKKTGKKLTFRENFRTVGNIIEPLNNFFENIMNSAKFEGSINKYTTEFNKEDDSLIPIRENFSDSPSIEFITPTKYFKTASQFRDNEAENVALWLLNRLPEICVEDRYNKGEIRKAKFSDVAILFKRTTHLNIYLNELKKYSIPYALENGKGFYKTSEIIDIYSIICILFGINTDFYLASSLRSPFCGITDETLAKLFSFLNPAEEILNLFKNNDEDEETEEFNYNIVQNSMFEKFMSSTLSGADLKISDEELQKIEDFRYIIKRLISVSKVLSPSTLLRKICSEFNYFYILKGLYLGTAKIANVEYLISIAENYENNISSSVIDFIEFLNKQQRRNTEREATAFSENAVRIMSVHKSKGIEFPIVILCDVWTSKKVDPSTIVSSPNLGVCLKLKKTNNKKQINYLVEKINLENEKREDAESLRLLYVALTRARDYLAIFIPNSEAQTTYSKKETILTYKAQDWYSLFLFFLGTDFWKENFAILENIRLFDAVSPQNMPYVKKGFISKIISLGNFGKKFSMRITTPLFEDISQISDKLTKFSPNLNYDLEIVPKTKDDTANLSLDIEKTLQPIGEYGNILYLTPTKILAWFLCKRKFLYEKFRESGEGLFGKIELTGTFLNKAVEIGSIVHYLLQNIDFSSCDTNTYKDELKDFIQSEDSNLKTVEQDTRDFAIKAVTNFLSIPKELKPFYKLDSEFYPEHNIYYTIGNDPILYIDGTIDMMIKTADNKICVIDYKTGSFEENKARFYENQILTYMLGLSKIFDCKIIYGYIVFLNKEKVYVHKVNFEQERVNAFEKILKENGNNILNMPLIENLWEKTDNIENCKHFECPYQNRCFLQ